ncbi:hypothetical protein [Streptococcus equi]|uniref:hypothetical protein n=1 Tax=Streptococcus equi TaxID=1336 RepID=UPI000DBE7069|nr:hypothetical protein [Streptococcus equi]MCD3397993.1 hypothetical protein [Streptococcus equi subsp. zooepidemicus]MCD3428298.1 hypothetical protein [Streptococcus equi subsp. zooepidemicus]HEL0015590.1 hypothetical protein [Streptococcus equi subsp. zooepidemicus]HEL0575172.1 hypothetical protein [Streptococcus equi subsp. zooepidemicus]HEL0638286.1 hypothetical protein [Streptococcus equi subsp. zooepidemicus]
MKKKLMLATALLALGTATNVKADYWSEPYPHGGYYGYDDPNRPTGDPRVWGFRNDWEKARDFGVKPIKENEETIEVKTVPDAVLSVVYKNINGEEEVIKKSISELQGRTLDGYTYSSQEIMQLGLANGSGYITFPLKDKYKPKQGDWYKLTLTIDGFYLAGGEWTVGDTPLDEKEAKEKEERKQKELETQNLQSEIASLELTNQANGDSAESQKLSSTESEEVEEYSTATQNNESAQQSDNTGHKEESFWAKHFTSSIRSAGTKSRVGLQAGGKGNFLL